VYSPNDLVQLIETFAQATLGAWHLEELSAQLIPAKRRRGAVQFRWRGALVRWAFEQETDWLEGELEKRIESFARRELAGEFLMLPTGDQMRGYLFLDRDVAADVYRALATCAR
jgi:hypothetical protein